MREPPDRRLELTVEFEGLEIRSADDLVRHFRDGTTTRIADERPYAWMIRFAAESDEAKEMLSEAIARLVDEIGGGTLTWSRELADAINLAQLTGVGGHLPALRAALRERPEDPQQAQRILRALAGSRLERSLELDDDEVDAVAELGARPGCFGLAANLLSAVRPWRLPGLITAAAAAADGRGEPAARELALPWIKSTFAPYRLETARSIDPAMRDAFRDAVTYEARLTRFPDDAGALLHAAWSDDADRALPFVKNVARTFVHYPERVKRELLIHPRDGEQLDLDPDFEKYARAVQERSDDADFRTATVTGVADPEPLEQPGSAAQPEGVTAFSVKVTVERESGSSTREETVFVYQLGERLKVAPLVAVAGGAPKPKPGV